jgi:hypothetical protein
MSNQIPEEALFTPEMVEAVKSLQTPGFVPHLKRQLEEIIDCFIDAEMDTLFAEKKLEYIRLLRFIENSLEPFSVEGGES